VKITQALLAEHVVFHNLFDYLDRVTPQLKVLAEVRALAALLEAMLEVHSKVEDELLIDPLEPAFSHLGQAENFHDEHHEITVNLKLIRSTRKLAEARRLLHKAVLVSRRHFDKEERIVFPLAEKQLSAKSLIHLGKRWEEQRKA
jgi:hemerythrin-like domain-containing protein